MITVRFPSGFSIQYNNANYVSRTENYSDLYEKKDGRWIAQVPTAGCVVEVVSPCRLYNPIVSGSDKVQSELSLLQKEVRSLKRKLGKVSA